MVSQIILLKKLNIIIEIVIGDSKMSERPGRSSSVIGPAGQPLNVDNLPPRDTVRWVIRRKAEVVTAVRNGLISMDDACERYRLSVEEFLNWEKLVSAHGLAACGSRELRCTGNLSAMTILPKGCPRTGSAKALRIADQGIRAQPKMPYDGPSTPVFEDSFLADISAGERVAKKWSLRQTGLFVVAVSTVLWGVIIFVVWQMT